MSDRQQQHPRRLLFENGEWVLELEELCPIGSSIFRPTIKAVKGSEAIRYGLSRLAGHERLAAQAEQIIAHAPANSDDRSFFVVEDDAWVAIPQAVRKQMQGALQPPRERMLREQARLEMMMAMYDQLGQLTQLQPNGRPTDRWQELEARISKLEQLAQNIRANGLPRQATGENMPPASPLEKVLPQASSPAEGGASKGVSSTLTALDISALTADALAVGGPLAEGKQAGYAESSGPAPGQDLSSATRPSSADQEKMEESQRLVIVKLPSQDEIQDLLQMLIDPKITIEKDSQSAPGLDRQSYARTLYIAPLLDQNGVVVGAWLADQKALVFLGGSMILLPKNMLDEMIRTKKIEEDVTDAFSEILNNLTSLINKLESNGHVSSSTAVPLVLGELPWITGPRVRQDWLETSMGGRIILLVK